MKIKRNITNLILPSEILHKIFSYYIIDLDYDILFDLFNLIKNNKEYKKIMIKNTFIENFENIYKETNYENNQMEKVIKVKKYNLNKIISNMDIIVKKNNNNYIYICFFDFFLNKVSSTNINYGFKQLIFYFASNINWSYIKKIYLIISKNFSAIKKLIDNNNMSSFFILLKYDKYVKSTIEKLLK